MKSISIISVLFLFFALVVAIPSVPAEEILFSEINPAQVTSFAAASKSAVKRTRYVAINFDLLDPAKPSVAAERIKLNFFADVSVVASRRSVEKRGGGNFTWIGNVDGDDFSSVLLVVENGVMAGYVHAGGALFRIRPTSTEGVHEVLEIDQSVYPREKSDPVSIPLPDVKDMVPPSSGDDDGSFIDVVVLYTDDVSLQYGTAAVEAEIVLAVADANLTYANSGVSQRLRLVDTLAVTYAESGDSCTDKTRAQNSLDGFIDFIPGYRDEWGADMISMLIKSDSGCGCAFIQDPVGSGFGPWAYSAVRYDCAVDNHSFAHELGHNMGARHNREEDASNTPYDHAHGYMYYPGRWRTVMSYNSAPCGSAGDYCTRLPYWSNPGNLWGGVPMGIATGNASAADNHLTLNKTDTTVSQFRTSRLPVVAVYRNGVWYMDRSGNGIWNSNMDAKRNFGSPGDYPVAGDWNGDGDDDMGVFRNGSWYLDLNDSRAWSGCAIDGCYNFGAPGDLPVVGKWIGTTDRIAVFRNGMWYIDWNGNRQWDGCVLDRCRNFGQAGDKPVAIDWNCDGVDEMAVYRNGSWYIDTNGNGAWNGCLLDRCFSFGAPGDIPVSGAWDAGKCEDIGVFRNGTWYLDSGNGSWSSIADDKYNFGAAGDLPVPGIW